MRNNSVFQVLITKGNQKILEVNKTVEDLKPGQIGIFDNETHLSIDGTKPVAQFYIASAVGKGGLVSDINFSTGPHIDTKLVKYVNAQKYVEPKEMTVKVSDFKAECGTPYSIKVRLENAKTLSRQGYIPFVTTYTVTTPECDPCDTSCGIIDPNVLVKLFVDQINSEQREFVIAKVVDKAGADIADMDAFIEANKDKVGDEKDLASLVITSQPVFIDDFANVPTEFFSTKETMLYVSLGGDKGHEFAKVETTQEVVYEQGSGINVKHREYIAGGWNGRPGLDRLSPTLGLARKGFKFYADEEGSYDAIDMLYHNVASGGWLHYENDLALEIYIPTADTETSTSFLTVLNKISAQNGLKAVALV